MHQIQRLERALAAKYAKGKCQFSLVNNLIRYSHMSSTSFVPFQLELIRLMVEKIKQFLKFQKLGIFNLLCIFTNICQTTKEKMLKK